MLCLAWTLCNPPRTLHLWPMDLEHDAHQHKMAQGRSTGPWSLTPGGLRSPSAWMPGGRRSWRFWHSVCVHQVWNLQRRCIPISWKTKTYTKLDSDFLMRASPERRSIQTVLIQGDKDTWVELIQPLATISARCSRTQCSTCRRCRRFSCRCALKGMQQQLQKPLCRSGDEVIWPQA
jgi:hypothetical protein